MNRRSSSASRHRPRSCVSRRLSSRRKAAGSRRAGPPRSARAAAPVDLTGTWVSVVTEDWQWRMVTPKKGDVRQRAAQCRRTPCRRLCGSVARTVMCEAYGVGGHHADAGAAAYQLAGRLHAEDGERCRSADATAAVRRTPRRPASPSAARPRRDAGKRSLQGDSVAEWQGGGAGEIDPFTGRGDRPGCTALGLAEGANHEHARRTGCGATACPTARTTVVTEYFTRFTHPQAGDWFVVTTSVDDPTYLTRLVHHQQQFQERADGRSACRICRIGDRTGRGAGSEARSAKLRAERNVRSQASRSGWARNPQPARCYLARPVAQPDRRARRRGVCSPGIDHRICQLRVAQQRVLDPAHCLAQCRQPLLDERLLIDVVGHVGRIRGRDDTAVRAQDRDRDGHQSDSRARPAPWRSRSTRMPSRMRRSSLGIGFGELRSVW